MMTLFPCLRAPRPTVAPAHARVVKRWQDTGWVKLEYTPDLEDAPLTRPSWGWCFLVLSNVALGFWALELLSQQGTWGRYGMLGLSIAALGALVLWRREAR